MLILGIDTALAACSAAIVRDGMVLATREVAMSRGHAEALAPLVSELAAEAGVAMAALERIAVTIGPGTFTGLRVGIAFARGLGLALGIPVIGISTTEAVAKGIGVHFSVGVHAAALDDIYIEAFSGGERVIPAASMALAAAGKLVCDLGGTPILAGTAADRLAALVPNATVFDYPLPNPVIVAALAAEREPASAPPSPLYLRPPHITQPKPK